MFSFGMDVIGYTFMTFLYFQLVVAVVSIFLGCIYAIGSLVYKMHDDYQLTFNNKYNFIKSKENLI